MDAQRDLQGLFKEKCMRSGGGWWRGRWRAGGETDTPTHYWSVGTCVVGGGGDEARVAADAKRGERPSVRLDAITLTT